MRKGALWAETAKITEPDTVPASSASLLLISRSSRRTSRAVSRKTVPSRVSFSPCLVRMKMGYPRSSSYFFKNWLRVGCEMYSRLAAAEMLLSSSMAKR